MIDYYFRVKRESNSVLFEAGLQCVVIRLRTVVTQTKHDMFSSDILLEVITRNENLPVSRLITKTLGIGPQDRASDSEAIWLHMSRGLVSLSQQGWVDNLDVQLLGDIEEIVRRELDRTLDELGDIITAPYKRQLVRPQEPQGGQAQ